MVLFDVLILAATTFVARVRVVEDQRQDESSSISTGGETMVESARQQ